MESTHKESIVSRLFGFGKRAKKVAQPEVPAGEPPSVENDQDEAGFARTADSPESSEDTNIRIPEQVIRVKPGRLKAKDEAITAINDSFKELTSLLSNVGERLERQDDRASDLAEQIKDLPDYLRSVPKLQQEQNQALHKLGDRIASTADSMSTMAGAVSQIPTKMEAAAQAQTDALRDVASGQEAAIRKVAAAQQQASKVIHHTHQQSLQVFHRATQQSLSAVQDNAKTHKRQMEQMLTESVTNMRRMFVLSGAFMVAAVVAVVALLLLR